MARQLTVKLTSEAGEQCVRMEASLNDTVATICSKVRHNQEWRLSKRIRMFCAGRELFEEETVAEIPGSVLHCTATDSPLQSLSKSRMWDISQRACQRTASVPAEWVEGVDPSTVLAWVCGLMLAAGALYHLANQDNNSGTCWGMLASMTLIYVLVFAPWSFLYTTHTSLDDSMQHTFDFDLPEPNPWHVTAIPARPDAPLRRRH